MSDRSAAIGLASASSGLPPPNSSACGLAMNDQVTASTMPRAASARLALRVRTCSGVSTGLRGVVAARRTASAACGRRRRCARPPRRCRPCPRRPARHDGTATFTVSPVAGDEEAEMVEDRAASRRAARRGRPAASPRRAGKSMTRFGGFGFAGDRDLRRRAAAEIEHHAAVASSSPGTMKAGSTPRSKR